MGLEAAGEEREKDTKGPCRIRFPTWGSLCQKGGQQRKRAGLRFPIFPIWGSNTRARAEAKSDLPDMGLEPMTSRLRVCHSTN